jgi:energy-coupling factor transporter transmembrane protein EcfT
MQKMLLYIRITFPLIFLFGSFFLPELWMQGAVFVLFAFLALLSPLRKKIVSFFYRFLFLILITLFVHLFLRFGESGYWAAFNTATLWDKALYFTLRNANILLIMSYIVKGSNALSTGNIDRYLDGKEPSVLIQPLVLALRYSAMIQDEFRSLQQVHRIMGIGRPRRLISRVKYYISLVFPTIIASLERAEYLSVAMTSRGYNKDLS